MTASGKRFRQLAQRQFKRVVFLAHMHGDHMLEVRVEQGSDLLAALIVRQMAPRAQYPLFQEVRVRSFLEHRLVMVALNGEDADAR